MDRQPVLAGARLLLRPLRPDDWDGLYAIGGNPQVWEQHPFPDRWREAMFRAFFADALAKGGALVVIDKVNGGVIGFSRFSNHDLVLSQVEIGGTFLAPAYWGGAANREMKQLMLAHALQAVERVLFLIGEGNGRSRRAMEKIGGVLTDRVDEIAGPDGPLHHVVYEVTRAGFAVGPLSA